MVAGANIRSSESTRQASFAVLISVGKSRAGVLAFPRMANRFYAEGEARAAKVNDLFATVAPRYDLINDLQSLGLHRGWKRRLARMARGSENGCAHGSRAGGRALDLCCGTGDVSFALARAGFATIGLDFSGPMLSVAANRLTKQS